MNKTETMLYIERLREGIRKLPTDANVYGFELAWHSDYKKRIVNIHLSKPVDGPAVPGTHYSGWHEMRLPLLPDVFAWWAETEAANE